MIITAQENAARPSVTFLLDLGVVIFGKGERYVRREDKAVSPVGHSIRLFPGLQLAALGCLAYEESAYLPASPFPSPNPVDQMYDLERSGLLFDSTA